MSAAKHTPGPWKFTKVPDEGGVRRCIRGNSATINVVAYTRHDTNPALVEEHDANARLIAAAPDLLEALEKMLAVEPFDFELNDLNQCECGQWDESPTEPKSCRHTKARAAIAKARGGA